MSDARPLTVICRYVVKPDKTAEMEALLRKHWGALHELGLVTDTPAKVYRGLKSEKPGGAHSAERTYVEIFEWKNADAPNVAHQTPAVMAVWEPMGALCEDMDFPQFEPIEL